MDLRGGRSRVFAAAHGSALRGFPYSWGRAGTSRTVAAPASRQSLSRLPPDLGMPAIPADCLGMIGNRLVAAIKEGWWDNCFMRQMQLFTSAELATMRDRSASRNHSPA